MKRYVAGLALILAVGCGEKPQPAAPTGAAVKAEAAVAPLAPQLTPVTKPAEWIVLGRVLRPRRFVETLINWSGIPINLMDLAADLKSLDGVVAWDAPLEVAAALDPRTEPHLLPPLAVFSIGLSSLDRALQVAREHRITTEPLGNGLVRLQIGSWDCAAGAALGPTPARLVCGDAWTRVEGLLPYALRGLPLEDLGSDELRLIARAAPLQQRYAQEIGAVRMLAGVLLRRFQSDNERLDRALSDAAYALADELKLVANDLDTIELRGRLDEAGGALELNALIGYAKQASQSAQLQADIASRASVPSPEFWSFPKSTSSATFSVGVDPRRLQPAVESLTEIADAYLELKKSPTAFRVRARGVISSLPSLAVGGAYGSQPLSAPEGADRAAKFAAGLGVHWGALNVRADVLTAWLTDVGALLSDREFARVTKPALQPAKFNARPVRVPGYAAVGKALRFDLPLAWVERWPAETSKTAPKRTQINIVVIPDGEKSWVSVASDEKAALAKLELVRSGKDGRLAEDTRLDLLKQAPSLNAGFTTLLSVLSSLRALGNGRDAVLARAPNHGASPWLTTVRAEPAAAGALKLNLSVRLPKTAFEDVPTILPNLALPGAQTSPDHPPRPE